MTLPEFIERAVSVPFVTRRAEWDGWDCWGLCRLAYRECLGAELPSHAEGYQSSADREAIRALVDAEFSTWEQVRAEEAQPFDIAVFRIAGAPVHIALMVDRLTMLHTQEHVGTHLDRIDSSNWSSRLEGIYRYV